MRTIPTRILPSLRLSRTSAPAPLTLRSGFATSPSRLYPQTRQDGSIGETRPELDSEANQAPDSMEGREERNSKLTEAAADTRKSAGSGADGATANRVDPSTGTSADQQKK